MNLSSDTPFKVQLCFAQVIEQLEKSAADPTNDFQERDSALLTEVLKYPELRDGITEEAQIERGSEVISRLLDPYFPKALTLNEIKAVNIPYAKLVFNQQSIAELNKDGLDEIQLLFSANAGQAPAPVNKVASGGELSRLMLAIKSLLAKHTSLPTLIFDEIDTGISGETALKVGEVIADLGNDMQILSITHLPQIAAKGESHYFVFKSEGNNKTTTGIRKLNAEERINAIAEMLSGKNPGASALQNAKDLLG